MSLAIFLFSFPQIENSSGHIIFGVFVKILSNCLLRQNPTTNRKSNLLYIFALVCMKLYSLFVLFLAEFLTIRRWFYKKIIDFILNYWINLFHSHRFVGGQLLLHHLLSNLIHDFHPFTFCLEPTVVISLRSLKIESSWSGTTQGRLLHDRLDLFWHKWLDFTLFSIT